MSDREDNIVGFRDGSPIRRASAVPREAMTEGELRVEVVRLSDQIERLVAEVERLRAAISDRMAKWKADHDHLEAEAAGWQFDFGNERAEVERLRSALAISDTEHEVLNAQIDGLMADIRRLEAVVQRVRDLPVYALLTTTEPDVPVVRKSDLDAALGGERDE